MTTSVDKDQEKAYHRGMRRTTVELDPKVFADLEVASREGGRNIDALASELLAEALDRREPKAEAPVRLKWTAVPMKPLVNIEDRELLQDALDQTLI